MNKTLKFIISIIVSVVGLGMYLLTYFLVPYTLEHEFLQYVIMVIGYVGVIIFPFGFYNFVKEIRNKKDKTTKIE